MASGGASALTLKLAAVAAVLTLLVIPSFARCPSLGPAPPPPAAQAMPPPPPVQATPPLLEVILQPPPAQASPPPPEAVPPPPPARAPPPPLEAIPPAPAPGPPRPRCDICDKECYPACTASHPDSKACNEKCYNDKNRCDQCRTPKIKECTANCTGSCGCTAESYVSCSDACLFQECSRCSASRQKDCKYQCNLDYCNGNKCW
ncbi:hypothetical protein D1007_48228 [Hordeum vulgare]|uniref:Bowman-Birk serine protease inhibitors family domain-containing protein n=1 Tax=Hordeum vulgare subsp. vulgare TaxID=112509 RepID=A0A8I6YZ22_HORVV|nr:hypothetical protein D1007_48228 [Hordeum vulgare]